MLVYKKGDATKPQVGWLLAHVVNDVGAWGAGFVLALSARWPDMRQQFRARSMRLGDVWYYHTPSGMIVASLCAQEGLRSRANPMPLRMEWLDYTLRKMYRYAKRHSLSVKMPRIGAGLAGGNWDDIEYLINRIANVETVVYSL